MYQHSMAKLDPHTLFSIFEQNDEEIYREHGVEHVLSNPYVLINMVGRGMENFHLMEKMYLRRYPKEYAKVREGIREKYFLRLYGFLTRIKLEEIEDIFMIGDSYDTELCKTALDDLRVWYELKEDYEKCAIIRDFINYLSKTHTIHNTDE